MVLPGLAPQKHSSRCDPALIKAIARGRAFEELVSGRARSLQELAKRDGISRRYIRRLIGLAFLSPQLIEAILQGPLTASYIAPCMVAKLRVGWMVAGCAPGVQTMTRSVRFHCTTWLTGFVAWAIAGARFAAASATTSRADEQ